VINERKVCGVRTDAERQGQNRDKAEQGTVTERPKRTPQIVHGGLNARTVRNGGSEERIGDSGLQIAIDWGELGDLLKIGGFDHQIG
jgi:hypothetical protein